MVDRNIELKFNGITLLQTKRDAHYYPYNIYKENIKNNKSFWIVAYTF